MKNRYCRGCGLTMCKSEFKGKSSYCMDCEAAGKRSNYKKLNKKAKELTDEVRWINSVKIKGYKYKGPKPGPLKNIDDYIPWEK